MNKRVIKLSEAFSPAQVAAAETLLNLIAPNAGVQADLHGKLRMALEDVGDYDYFSDLPIIWMVAQFAGFYVDWKNTEEIINQVRLLAHQWGRTDFVFPEDLRTLDDEPLNVPELLEWARRELEASGLLLWHWDTQEDNYCGAISRESDWAHVEAACSDLGVSALPADQRFDGSFNK